MVAFKVEKHVIRSTANLINLPGYKRLVVLLITQLNFFLKLSKSKKKIPKNYMATNCGTELSKPYTKLLGTPLSLLFLNLLNPS